MRGEISIAALIIVAVLLPSIHSIFPTPTYQEFNGAYFKAANQNACFDFTWQISGKTHEYGLQLGNQRFELIQNRIQKTNSCSKSLTKINELKVRIQHNENIKKQGYWIQTLHNSVQIQISSYAGFVYALQTFSQLMSQGNQYALGIIKDQPLVSHRGIMIDSVRHFLSFQAIKRLIQSMPLSKLNILHWHLSDDEAFTLELATHPELADAGRYDSQSSYSISQVKQLINIAKANAVTIVPEFDTPGHVRSWGLSKKWQDKNVTILCPRGEGYNHQLDLSLNQTYTLAQQVLQQVDNIFKDSPYLHLGGDQVFGSCWNLRPAIQTFMKLKNIKSYGQLQMYWRYELKQSLPKGRKTVFWLNLAEDIVTGPDDILHYWGNQAETAKIAGQSQSKLILSPLDFLYLNMGKGNIWQNATSGPFKTWRQIYTNFTVFPQGINRQRILGAEVCLWGEVSNEDTLENNLWMRASAFAAKAWSDKMIPTDQLVTELVKLKGVLQEMGVQPSPVVSEFCEMFPSKCFPSQSGKQQKEILSE